MKRKVLLVGAGSGRDTASVSLVVPYIFADINKIKFDILGFLTPWSIHRFNEKMEGPINCLDTSITNVKKIVYPNRNLSNFFYERYLLKILLELGYHIGNIYLVSLHYNFEKIFTKLRSILEENKYDEVIVVDVGGDILFPISRRYELSTPIVDFFSRSLFLKLFNLYNIDMKFIVFGFGLTGDINPSYSDVLFLYKPEKTVLIRKEDIGYKAYKHTNDSIEKLTKARSYSFSLLKEIVENNLHSLKTINFKKSYKIGNLSFSYRYRYIVDTALSRILFIYNAENLKKLHYDLKSLKYLYRLFLYVSSKGSYGTEIDFTIIPFPSIDKSSSLCYIISPFEKISLPDKIKLTSLAFKLWYYIQDTKYCIVNEDYLNTYNFDNMNISVVKKHTLDNRYILVEKTRR